MAGTSDWLDVRGWMESIVGWSMDQVHDLLLSDIGLGPLGSVNLQEGSIQSPQDFLFTTIMCTIVFATMMLTLMVVPYVNKFIANYGQIRCNYQPKVCGLAKATRLRANGGINCRLE